MSGSVVNGFLKKKKHSIGIFLVHLIPSINRVSENQRRHWE